MKALETAPSELANLGEQSMVRSTNARFKFMVERREKHFQLDDWKAAVPHLSEFGPVEASNRFGGGVAGRFGRHHDEESWTKCGRNAGVVRLRRFLDGETAQL